MTIGNAYVSTRYEEIRSNLIDAKVWATSDPRLEAYLSGYFTVLISGMVEDCIEHLIRQRCANTNDRELTDFVSKLVDQRFRTPNSSSIADLLGMFSDSHRQQYLAEVPIPAREALGSIVANRMAVAHTGTWKSNATIGEIEQYFGRIEPVLEAVENVLL